MFALSFEVVINSCYEYLSLQQGQIWPNYLQDRPEIELQGFWRHRLSVFTVWCKCFDFKVFQRWIHLEMHLIFFIWLS